VVYPIYRHGTALCRVAATPLWGIRIVPLLPHSRDALAITPFATQPQVDRLLLHHSYSTRTFDKEADLDMFDAMFDTKVVTKILTDIVTKAFAGTEVLASVLDEVEAEIKIIFHLDSTTILRLALGMTKDGMQAVWYMFKIPAIIFITPAIIKYALDGVYERGLA
jgi:hypothetical protein